MAPRNYGGNRPPSMADVAALAGVSHQTVSRVMNDSASVRPHTRQRVLDAIEELGYRRNEAARTLATRKSRLIGLITADFVSYGPSSTILSVQLAAKDCGYLVSVAVLEELTKENLTSAIDRFLGQGVAGIIISVPLDKFAAELDEITHPVPAIAVASTWPASKSSVPRVGVDQTSGVSELLDHLQRLGCEEVAHLAGPADWLDAQQRERAWQEGCRARGIVPAPLLRGDWSAESGYKMTKEILRGGLPRVLFTANDQMALGALLALAEAEIKVGEDVLVAGFDDEPGSAFFNPPLTTVRQDYARLGKEAVSALLAEVRREHVADVLIPSELIIRASA